MRRVNSIDSIGQDIYKRLFKEITFRRAENVHRAGGELLKALGLPDGASVEEIAEALGYEG